MARFHPGEMMSALVLIDYYNLPTRLTRRGIVPLWDTLRASVFAEAGEEDCDVALRLYGGWYDDKGLSRDGERLARDIGNSFPFLIRQPSGLQRIHCELASSLYKVRDSMFPATLRDRRGFKHTLKSQEPIPCAHPDRCSIPLVTRWIKGRCPEPQCNVSSRDAFRYREQKLVDTLMCCDLISAALESSTTPALVVSEDDDLVPAMVLATHLGGNVCHIRTTPSRRRHYDEMMIQSGIRKITVQ